MLLYYNILYGIAQYYFIIIPMYIRPTGYNALNTVYINSIFKRKMYYFITSEVIISCVFFSIYIYLF